MWALYHKLSGLDFLFSDAFQLYGDAAEAEDFAFRTFDKVLRKIDTFKGEGPFYDWMKAILVNDIRSAKRTKAAQNIVVAEVDEDEPFLLGIQGKCLGCASACQCAKHTTEKVGLLTFRCLLMVQKLTYLTV